MKKQIIITCPTLSRELEKAMKEAKVSYPIHFLPQRLHSNPKELHIHLQKLIDKFEEMDRIMICVSSCGKSTVGLTASHCEVVIPKSQDCIDILLSKTTLKEVYRPPKAIFLTEDWMNFMKNSSLDLQTAIKKQGREKAEETLRKIYKGFENFYIIDTGVYDTKVVEEYISPLISILQGTLHKITGEYQILRKMLKNNFDEDFIILSKGKTVIEEDFKR